MALVSHRARVRRPGQRWRHPAERRSGGNRADRRTRRHPARSVAIRHARCNVVARETRAELLNRCCEYDIRPRNVSRPGKRARKTLRDLIPVPLEKKRKNRVPRFVKSWCWRRASEAGVCADHRAGEERISHDGLARDSFHYSAT